MDTSLVAPGDKFLTVRLLADETKRGVELPVAHLPLDDVQVSLGDGRTIRVRQQPGGSIITVTDLEGNTLAEVPVPPQSAEMTAKAARLEAAAKRFAERMSEAVEEAEGAIATVSDATSLPPIALPGPKQVN